jgi:hypothetical protein
MLLTADDGAQLEAHIVGYESAINDMNWLLVAIHVSTPQGSGTTVENCWQIEEVQRMIAWFHAMAHGVPVQRWGGACLEANLEFELVATSVAHVTVRATFILETGLWHPDDGGASVSHYHGSIDFDLTREDLQQIAGVLAEELHRYPPIAPLRTLPSPFL